MKSQAERMDDHAQESDASGELCKHPERFDQNVSRFSSFGHAFAMPTTCKHKFTQSFLQSLRQQIIEKANHGG